MSDCCPPRAAFAAPPSGAARVASPPRSDSRFGSLRTAIAAQCLRLLGWYRLERLLASIPDSNDDFGIG
ncbi:hypothetical protein [Burkholderia anthina]|uniref:hypothetical protein n=1 Tax=Burkholderia anthina TaxID=179879 RepID=UPI001AA05285|nr:hypothetical protein [Burkholderia anthina]QTD93105.1 hypothetical protein J4G50_19680 [Burkholderia anthina]